ncbi:hypothetical protein PROFUN_09238 [Planoprotostelium fungivorum]|uniref:Uncharacterized protein n=1 Tax=Planoprotostelium fungivorum TaxID=1890364 RepID=A0A2P6NHM7_9EUKA|nr:hypothetical protein PROFUN_09238 [Planoprotostelium fungivorum]
MNQLWALQLFIFYGTYKLVRLSVGENERFQLIILKSPDDSTPPPPRSETVESPSAKKSPPSKVKPKEGARSPVSEVLANIKPVSS